MRVLGISAFYHDAAAALVDEGRIIAAAQEERFTRKRHDAEFPAQAIAYCLEKAGYAIEDLDHVVFYDKPFLKFERLLETYVALAPRGFRSFKLAVPVWLREKLFQRSLLQKELALGESYTVPAELGEVIGGYRLDSVLGLGGMGCVYVGVHARLGRRSGGGLGAGLEELQGHEHLALAREAAGQPVPEVRRIVPGRDDRAVLHVLTPGSTLRTSCSGVSAERN